jgi:membrane protease subunit (stomatin/prohibitin family)
MVLDFLRKQFIDVIQWQEEPGELAWRVYFPDQEIQNGAQLTVREGQTAAFFDEGKLVEFFRPGLHTLDTANFPFITSLRNWDKAFESPHKSDIIFFSLKEQTGLKWGTPQPITVRDAEFGALRIRAFGSYSIAISDVQEFAYNLLGTLPGLSVGNIEQTLRGAIQTAIATGIANSGVPFLDLAANQQKLSDTLRGAVEESFKRWGIGCLSFFVESVSLPEEVQRHLDKGSSMRVIGDLDRYAKFQSAEALEKAAGQEGGLAGMGAGMGAAAAIGATMAQGLGQGTQAAAPAATAAPAGDPFELIEKLHRLLTAGAITQEEFDSKKTELLARLK